MNIIINGPLSAQNRNILVAIDFKSARVILIKLLRLPEFYSSKETGHDQLVEEINTEVQTCQRLSEQNIVGLVACTATVVEAQYAHDLDVSQGAWKALKMKRYSSSLALMSHHPEFWIKKGFNRISNALEGMHKLNLVHMDVK
jgi:serine/threonine protein kinase